MPVFGPVPSRRLGRSMGINNIPPKICSYACVYCQLGRTIKLQTSPQTFYEPQEITDAVREQVDRVRAAGEAIDYLTFVPDGEPTLDRNLGREIALLRPLGVPIAVISNASLLWRADVRAALQQADWVSLKVDAVTDAVWRRIDRPYGTLRLSEILAGIREFAATFKGNLVTETMLVAGLNDDVTNLLETAAFVAKLNPDIAYLSIPTRPPAETWVHPADETALNRAYQLFSRRLDCVEYLIGYEGNVFTVSGDAVEDLLSITAVHPMREDAVQQFLARAGADWGVVRQLIGQEQLVEAEYAGRRFYLRKFRRPHKEVGNDST